MVLDPLSGEMRVLRRKIIAIRKRTDDGRMRCEITENRGTGMQGSIVYKKTVENQKDAEEGKE
jgi:hypothetical protein